MTSLKSFEEYGGRSRIKFDEPLSFCELHNLMDHIGNSPDYDVRYRFLVERSVKRNISDESAPKIRGKHIGKITGNLLLTEKLVTVDFECLEGVDSDDQTKYEGIKFSTFNSHYHPEERIQTWDEVRERVQSYFELKDREKALREQERAFNP